MKLPAGTDSAKVTVVVKSTLAFSRKEGHRYTVGFNSCPADTINFNHNLNEDKANIYTVFYPTVARRVVENTVTLPVKPDASGFATLTLSPLDPGIVFEKIIVDLGGYKPGYLFGKESPYRRQ